MELLYKMEDAPVGILQMDRNRAGYRDIYVEVLKPKKGLGPLGFNNYYSIHN